MKKKGFTLVELLAVIVILAIIAVIATPIILNVIENAKKGAAEASASGYIDAIEKGILEEELKGNNIEKTGLYEVSSLTFVNVKGDKPTEGWISLNKGVVTDYSLKIEDYVISYDETNKKVVTEKNGEVEETPGEVVIPGTPSTPQITNILLAGLTKGTAVYFNPETKTICDEASAVSTTGTKTGCMKWYVYKDNGDGTYQLILDHNTTATVAWNSTNSNSEMKEVKTALDTDTITWNTELNARLITADEIAEITGNATFNALTTPSSLFYLDSNNQNQTANSTTKSKYTWLFDYTNGCSAYGCNLEDSSNYGYWTSTPVSGSTSNVWRVFSYGYLGDFSSDTIHYGVRPVITV